MKNYTGCIEDTELTKTNMMFSEIPFEMNSRSSKGKKYFKVLIPSLKNWVRKWKETMFCFFEDQCESGLVKMLFHLLDSLCNEFGERL